MLDWSTLSCRVMCTSPLAGWVRCFVLNHAAKLLLFSHFCCLTKGQFPPIHPSLSFLKEKCIFGVQTGRNLTKNIKKMLLFRKSDDFFGLCTEKVWLYLKKIVTLWANVRNKKDDKAIGIL